MKEKKDRKKRLPRYLCTLLDQRYLFWPAVYQMRPVQTQKSIASSAPAFSFDRPPPRSLLDQEKRKMLTLKSAVAPRRLAHLGQRRTREVPKIGETKKFVYAMSSPRKRMQFERKKKSKEDNMWRRKRSYPQRYFKLRVDSLRKSTISRREDRFAGWSTHYRNLENSIRMRKICKPRYRETASPRTIVKRQQKNFNRR